MYMSITNIVGEKEIDLAYPIKGNEVAVVSVFSDNNQYEFTKAGTMDLGSRNKQIEAETYTSRELSTS